MGAMGRPSWCLNLIFLLQFTFVRGFSILPRSRIMSTTTSNNPPANQRLSYLALANDSNEIDTVSSQGLEEELPPTIYQVPSDNTGLHLKALIACTAPWYLYTSLQMTVFDVPEDFFGLSTITVQLLGIYVFVSQLGVYMGCQKLSKANTLAEAQQLVGIMTLLCIPADVIGTLYEPNGSAGLTVLAFASVTLCFGIFLAHYLRKAAFRECPPQETTTYSHHQPLSIMQTLKQYRPPAHGQASHMAVEFTRGFVSFTISVGALGRFFAEGHEPNVWIVASLISVVLHTSFECFIATTFPGAELEENDSYLAFESMLYAVHMFASSIASHSEGFGDSLVDQALFAWLFGSATGKLIDRAGKLLGKFDFDALLGLSKL